MDPQTFIDEIIPAVNRHAARHFRHRADAEDKIQDSQGFAWKIFASGAMHSPGAIAFAAVRDAAYDRNLDGQGRSGKRTYEALTRRDASACVDDLQSRNDGGGSINIDWPIFKTTLSAEERTIVNLLIKGLTVKEIAKRINKAECTVRGIRQDIESRWSEFNN